MYTVMNRIPVPAAGAEGFEERFAGSMRGTLPDVPGLVGARLPRPRQKDGAYAAVMDFADGESFAAWTRSQAFRAAHGRCAGGSAERPGSAVEAFETVFSVGA